MTLVLYLACCKNFSASALSRIVFLSPFHVKMSIVGNTSQCFTSITRRRSFAALKALLFSTSSLDRSSKRESLQPSYSNPRSSLAMCSNLSRADERKNHIKMVQDGLFTSGLGTSEQWARSTSNSLPARPNP
ncbi:hypothetical protein AMECASPLE_022154 [Ameca splendens]|uniref:Uncharacterized protein n=1 Tax=Ameca splendens TaxID=208324 RepID=A0ABV1ABH3_9TELE